MTRIYSNFLGGLLLLVLAGTMLVRLPTEDIARVLFRPGPMSWSLANVLGVLAVLAGLVAFVAGLGAGRSSLQLTFILGLAAGLASSLPIWWAFYRAGVHSALHMSREAAWRIHIVFGDLALLFGIAHGIAAFISADAGVILNNYWTGLVGLILMYLGVLPSAAHHFKLLSYDNWKIFHLLSFVGYVFSLIHMFGHAKQLRTTHAWAIAVVNLAALVSFVAQKVFAKATATRAEVVAAQVLEEQTGRHLFLRIRAPGFKFAPGQWAYFGTSAWSVAHPFTIVPGDQPGEVQFFIKVSGPFTAGLAKACECGTHPRVILEGPYGTPPIPSPLTYQAVVFIVGGVGVTPALSLLAEARKSCGHMVAFYWAVRSPGLLARCAPLLEPHLNSQLSCIRLDGAPAGNANNLPLSAREGREDVNHWLAGIDGDLSTQGVRTALLFICGPPPLMDAAQGATSSKATGVSWHVHVEQFLFLPKPPSCGCSGKRPLQSTHQVQPSTMGAVRET